MKTALRLGLIGMGNMGSLHARIITEGKIPGLELRAVCDENPERMEKWSGGSVQSFATASELIGSGSVDAVLIATPHYSHTTIGIEALKAGLHVLVEKPISVHKADAEALLAAHQDPKQVFGAMFNQRTDPRYQKLRELTQNGELGRIHRINWIITDWYRTESYYASGGWRATWAGEGGGVLLNQCPHQLDLLCWLFGKPERVRAFCQIGRFHEIEVEDSVTAYLEFPDGATGVFITTTGEAPGTNRLEIAAERGRVVIEGADIQFIRNEVSSRDWSRDCPDGFAMPPVREVRLPVSGVSTQHAGILRDFTRSCLEGSELLAPASEGIHSVELANAMLYSSETGSTVELPLDAGAFAGLLKKKIERSTFVKRKSEPSGPANLDNSF